MIYPTRKCVVAAFPNQPPSFPQGDLLDQITNEKLQISPEQLPPVPLETLSEQIPQKYLNMEIQDYMVAFSGMTQSYCVGVVDMVDSTKISARLSVNQYSKYYGIFLNTMARILNRFGGMIIKNAGDSLMFYFPESSKGRRYGFMTCIEGCLAMVEAHTYVGEIVKKEKLPALNYRISCDYGPVIIMKQNESSQIDMLGPPVNICNKINRMAPHNCFIIGADLYETVKKFPEYSFTSNGTYSSELKSSYPVYLVSRK